MPSTREGSRALKDVRVGDAAHPVATDAVVPEEAVAHGPVDLDDAQAPMALVSAFRNRT